MNQVVVGILGFLCIIAIVVTLFKSKTLPSIAFILFPSVLALILVLGGYYSFDDIASLIKAGFKSTGPTAALFVFSVLFFGIMTDADVYKRQDLWSASVSACRSSGSAESRCAHRADACSHKSPSLCRLWNAGFCWCSSDQWRSRCV